MSKVYCVIGGIDYEGEDFKSLRLFDCFSAAVAYQKHLEENEGFDYAILETREVNVESAIAANDSNLNTKDGITTPWWVFNSFYGNWLTMPTTSFYTNKFNHYEDDREHDDYMTDEDYERRQYERDGWNESRYDRQYY